MELLDRTVWGQPHREEGAWGSTWGRVAAAIHSVVGEGWKRVAITLPEGAERTERSCLRERGSGGRRQRAGAISTGALCVRVQPPPPLVGFLGVFCCHAAGRGPGARPLSNQTVLEGGCRGGGRDCAHPSEGGRRGVARGCLANQSMQGGARGVSDEKPEKAGAAQSHRALAPSQMYPPTYVKHINAALARSVQSHSRTWTPC